MWIARPQTADAIEFSLSKRLTRKLPMRVGGSNRSFGGDFTGAIFLMIAFGGARLGLRRFHR